MKYLKTIFIFLVILFGLVLSSQNSKVFDWGFYAHKLINRMAVFTLPSGLIEFYKSNIDFISKHAIDPDKRRYAVKGEAIRHYMDLDHWGENSLDVVPKDYTSAIILSSHFYWIRQGEKTVLFDTLGGVDFKKDSLNFSVEFLKRRLIPQAGIAINVLRQHFNKVIFPYYDVDEWKVPGENLRNIFPWLTNEDYILIDDRFSLHGILPYNLERVYYQLIDAFKTKNKTKILRLSADIGHYVGDAHVPLHTTKNYNGQLTNQDGIHAFWESRIPELFAESEFDFVVGPARYIDDVKSFIWQFLKESHMGVSLVLNEEKYLSQQTPADQQYCYDERLGTITKIQCREYSKAYHKRLDFQVEERMRASILNLGIIWMSAWVEAGQPDLEKIADENIPEENNPADSVLLKKQKLPIRAHE